MCKLLSLIPTLFLFALTALGQTTPDANPEFGLNPGVVVEEAKMGFEGARAGLREGNVLLRWRRGDAGGKIESPFDLLSVELEQAPLGAVTIEGLRRAQKRIWILGADAWQLTARPNFRSHLLTLYDATETVAKTSGLTEAIQQWKGISKREDISEIAWLPCWLLYHAAESARKTQQWENADELYQNAIRNASQLTPGVIAAVERRWAETYDARAEWDKAEGLLQQAADEEFKLHGENLTYAMTLYMRGRVVMARGDLDNAQRDFGKALGIQMKLVPAGTLHSALSAGDLAWVYSSEGNVVEAERYATITVSLMKKLTPGSRNLGTSLTLLADIALLRGDLAAAHHYLEQALWILKTSGESLATAAAMISMAIILREEGSLVSAEKYFRKALGITRRLDTSGLYVASALNSLGVIAQRQGHLADSELYLRQGLAIAQRVAPESLVLGEILNDLGRVLLDRDKLEDAEATFRQALTIRRKLMPQSARHAETLAALAGILRRKQQWDEAAKFYEQALNALETQTARLGGSEDVRSGFRAKHESYYKDYIDLLIAQNQPERAFQILERSRARTLLETLATAHVDIRKGVDPTLVEQERVLQQKLTARSNSRIQLLGDKHREEQLKRLDEEIAGLLSQYHAIEGQIRAGSPAYAALTQPQPLTAKEVQQQLLDDDTVLLEYSLGKERSYLFLLSPAILASFELPSRMKIEEQARMVYRLLTARNRMFPGDTAARKQARVGRAQWEYKQAVAELGLMLLSPVADTIKGKRLLIVSDGALAYIPFAMLPEKETGEPLMVHHEIVNLPSSSVLAALRQQQEGRPEAPKAVAVLADPVFVKDDFRVTIRDRAAAPEEDSRTFAADLLVRSAGDVGLKRRGALHLERLLFSREEAAAIAAVTPHDQAMQALDFRANRATAMSSDLGQYRIVHFATHGLLDSRNPELSGLVLSLVDQRGRPQNGFLELRDIYNLNLSADLVVLSACETGLGKEVDGEGLIGLTRGFMYAGASRVVASLWNVSDAGTAKLMREFYQAMEQEGMPPSAALRAAQTKLWKQARWSDPYYWAAFQIQGEWK